MVVGTVQDGGGLLDRVLERGWDELTRKEFLKQYGSLIHYSILYHIRRCFGAAQVSALSDHLRALREGKSVSTKGGIRGKLLDLARDTWQDIFIEAWKPQGNLIEKWHKYKQEREEEEKGFRDFEPYLKGAIHNTFWRNLRRKRLDEVTVDFEEVQGRLKVESGRPLSEEIPIANEVYFYWDQLLRCRSPNPDKIERELIQIRRKASTVLVWACARLKRDLRGKGKEEALQNLKAFMAFYCSQKGSRRGKGKGELSASVPSPDQLNLEQVAGRYFRWEEDICRMIFRKSIRKDRVMRQIRDVILNSPYRDMLQ